MTSWWQAIDAHGLDGLSGPELAHALQELTHDPDGFLQVLAVASDYPRVGLCTPRLPDAAEIARLDRDLPRSRCAVLPEDELGLLTAVSTFEAVLVLDPAWRAPDLLYAAWHCTDGVRPEHASTLHRLLAPGVRLSRAREVVTFIPDHLPGSWNPFPVLPSLPAARAAALLYWADRLRAVAMTSVPPVAHSLRDLATAGPDLQGSAVSEETVCLTDCSDLETALHSRPALPLGGPSAERARRASSLGASRGQGHDSVRPWCHGVGAGALPDISLALRRALLDRPIRSGHPGVAYLLRRQAVYLVPAA
jgi:hypothetical protein